MLRYGARPEPEPNTVKPGSGPINKNIIVQLIIELLRNKDNQKMQTEFTPLLSLGGGALIGLAAVILMLTLGRVAGATGILSGVFYPADEADRIWRIVMIAGMASAPMAVLVLNGYMANIQIPVSREAIIAGGFIVGIGVTLGNGCTSGHGVCGMARLSPRSIIATLSFMASTTVTVFIIRHVIGG